MNVNQTQKLKQNTKYKIQNTNKTKYEKKQNTKITTF